MVLPRCSLAELLFNPIALRKAKIVCNFGLPACNRVKQVFQKKTLVIKMLNAGQQADRCQLSVSGA